MATFQVQLNCEACQKHLELNSALVDCSNCTEFCIFKFVCDSMHKNQLGSNAEAQTHSATHAKLAKFCKASAAVQKLSPCGLHKFPSKSMQSSTLCKNFLPQLVQNCCHQDKIFAAGARFLHFAEGLQSSCKACVSCAKHSQITTFVEHLQLAK